MKKAIMKNAFVKILCLVPVLIALTMVLGSCENKDDEDNRSLNEYGFTGSSIVAYDFFSFAGDVVVELAHREDMPSWLVAKITSGDDVRLWAVWEGSCNGKTIYLLYNVYMSSLYDGYGEEGNKFVFASEEEKTQYLSSDTNHWKRIY